MEGIHMLPKNQTVYQTLRKNKRSSSTAKNILYYKNLRKTTGTTGVLPSFEPLQTKFTHKGLLYKVESRNTFLNELCNR